MGEYGKDEETTYWQRMFWKMLVAKKAMWKEKIISWRKSRGKRGNRLGRNKRAECRFISFLPYTS